MIAEGKITIEMSRDGAVRLQSSRPEQIGRLFEARSADEVLKLLPVLFSLCAHAHVSAARQALSVQADAATLRSDSLLVLAENAREHLLRILLGWRTEEALEASVAAEVMSLVARMASAKGVAAEHEVAETLERLLAEHVFGAPPERFLDIGTIADFHAWVGHGQGLGPRYLAQVIARGWPGLGEVAVQSLPELPCGPLLERMTEPGFAERPDWQGVCYETGPLARHEEHPLMAMVIEEHGTGLLARLTARLVELAQIPAQMRTPDVARSETPGLGVVETARGRLLHAANVHNGVVADYRILAPTEWNFHPQGTAVRALGKLETGAERAAQACALVEAIDPCVDFEVRAA